MTHTPGPWKPARSGFGQARSIIATEDGKPVTIAEGIRSDEDQAVMVAAPAMLNTLELILFAVTTDAVTNGGMTDREAIEQMARATIDAAKHP